jgi:predicted AlkP superfamily phosphohydrolase/phosphomutase
MDLTGLLRINVRGREREGTVAPDAEYAALCAELESFFKSLGDAGSATPVVAEVVRAYSDTPPDARHRDGQPDLILKWREVRTRDVRRLLSSELPAFQCDVPRYLPSGRSGNHRPLGWFVATGPGIAAGRRLGIYDIVDLAPTARQELGLEPEPGFHGRPMPLRG